MLYVLLSLISSNLSLEALDHTQ